MQNPLQLEKATFYILHPFLAISKIEIWKGVASVHEQ